MQLQTSSPQSPISRTIILTLDSAGPGGIETHVLTLAKHLTAKGYHVQVLFFRRYPDHPLYVLLTEQGIKSFFALSLKDYWRQLHRLAHHAILHTHGYKAGIIGRLFARMQAIPVISTYHSGDLGKGRVRLYSWLDQLTSRLAPRIAVSEAIQKRLPSGTWLIPNFVNAPPIETQAETPSEQPKKQQVAFVGRVSHEKGPDLFCQLAQLSLQGNAPQQLQDQHFQTNHTAPLPDIEFALYGNGPERPNLINQYHEFVTFKGHVNMPEYWHQVDLLCISSRYEGLPYVALEAMALGIPVASFDVGGMAKLIYDGSLGYIVEAGNIHALKAAIDSWRQLSPADQAQLSQNANETIRAHYSTEVLVPQIEAIYHRC